MSWRSQPRDEKGRWKKRHGAVAVAVAGTVAYGTVSVGTGGGGVASLDAGLSQATRMVLKQGKSVARKGSRTKTWKRMRLDRVGREARERLIRAASCAANSYGEVQQFLLRTPCRKLDRILVALDDDDGNRIAVSVSWVEMGSRSAARRLAGKADIDGTGNITPLPSEFVGASDISWTGRNYASRRSKRTAVIAEVEPINGNPSHAYLDGIAGVAVLFPRL